MFSEEAGESVIVFRNTESPTDHPSPVHRSPPGSPSGSADLQYEDVLDMVQRLHKELGLITLDNDKIRTVCNQLLKDNQARDWAIGDLTGLVQGSLDRPTTQRPRPEATQQHPIIQPDLIDNLRAEDIGITWEGSDTFLHGVRLLNRMLRRCRGDSICLLGNIIKREENMKFKKKIRKIVFFSIFKKFIKNSNNIASISKTKQHSPMTWCMYMQSLEKIQQYVFELQCEN